MTSLLAFLLGAVFWFSDAAALSIPRQDAAAPPVEVGAGPVAEQAFAVVGRNEYAPDSVTLFGYLTTVIGVEPALLFSGATPSTQTARFTYAGQVSVSSRSTGGDVTTIAGAGTLRVFIDDQAGANWDDPRSFADGQPVAEFSIDLRDAVQRQAPGVGVVVGDERLTQERAGTFTIEATQYRFGEIGIEQRLHFVGALIGDSRGTESLEAAVNGGANVSRRESISVRLGNVATPPVATPTSLACPELQPWLDDTLDRLKIAQSLGSALEIGQDPSSLNEQQLSRAAADISALSAARREAPTPATAAGPNRLVVTALSTYARGLQTIATAAANGDQALLDQGQAVLADGDKLIERAREAARGLAASCPTLPASTIATS